MHKFLLIIKRYWPLMLFILIGLFPPAIYAITRMKISSFVDGFVGNLIATVIGLIIGIPIALQINDIQAQSEKKIELKKLLEKKAKIFHFLVSELFHNKKTLSVYDKMDFEVARFTDFRMGFRNEAWNTLRQSNVVEWADDLDLIQKLIETYYYIDRLKYIEWQFMELSWKGRIFVIEDDQTIAKKYLDAAEALQRYVHSIYPDASLSIIKSLHHLVTITGDDIFKGLGIEISRDEESQKEIYNNLPSEIMDIAKSSLKKAHDMETRFAVDSMFYAVDQLLKEINNKHLDGKGNLWLKSPMKLDLSDPMSYLLFDKKYKNQKFEMPIEIELNWCAKNADETHPSTQVTVKVFDDNVNGIPFTLSSIHQAIQKLEDQIDKTIMNSR